MRISSVYWPIHLTTFAVGLILAMTLLSGDSLGRVNLLYLLLLYFALPVVGVVASLYALIFNGKAQLLQWLLRLGIYKLLNKDFFREIRRANQDRNWLLQQSQIMAMTFAVSSVLALFIVLLFSDVSFVWRSTLLTPEPVYVMLKTIAAPWFFWSSAQPDLALLQATQEYRLADKAINPNAAGSWWLFILATQLFYSVFLRSLIFLLLQFRLNSAKTKATPVLEKPKSSLSDAVTTSKEVLRLNELDDFSDVIIWHTLPLKLETQTITNKISEKLRVNPWHGTESQQELLKQADKPLIIVKGWEPPMAELSDTIANNEGYILILGWQDNQIAAVNAIQRDEWARFCGLNNWQLVVIEEQSYDD